MLRPGAVLAAVQTRVSVQIPVDVSERPLFMTSADISYSLDLSYYEVQQILSSNSDLKPIHDKTAAVKYLVFGTNQWISYDDKDTFKQKVDWANEIGFGGSLIWASDLGRFHTPRDQSVASNFSMEQMTTRGRLTKHSPATIR